MCITYLLTSNLCLFGDSEWNPQMHTQGRKGCVRGDTAMSKTLGFIEAEQIFHGISFFDHCLFFPFGKPQENYGS